MVFPGKTHNAQKQETEMLYRGVHGIKLILLLTDKGLLTLDAIKWCDEQNIAVLMLDSRGNVIQSLSPENLSNASLRRKQYADNVSGKIAHELVKRKIIAQLDTLKSHLELPGRDNAIDILTSAIQEISGNTLPGQFYDVDWLRTFEARAACAYFNAWTGLRIKWDTQAKKTIPPMWQSVSARTSPLSKNHGGRHAVCPLQAIVNYDYAILEAQVRQALNACGFDVTCGWLHSNKLYRDSLVFDLMELHRASVDHLVLKLINTLTLVKGDCMSTSDGSIKFNPQLSRFIAAACKLAQEDINVSAKWLKDYLLAL